ncbi:MAG: hypothetical protein ACT4QD_14580 [Acidobacteriota bacterium]
MNVPGSKAQDQVLTRGSATWAPAEKHLPENVGKTASELILVELKKR